MICQRDAPILAKCLGQFSNQPVNRVDVRVIIRQPLLNRAINVADRKLAEFTDEEVQEILKQAGFRSIIPQSAETIA